jgi:hypothetical protein
LQKRNKDKCEAFLRVAPDGARIKVCNRCTIQWRENIDFAPVCPKLSLALLKEPALKFKEAG